jgi:hypothetical protein
MLHEHEDILAKDKEVTIRSSSLIIKGQYILYKI